ncbi:hypothetical protein [Undibacterium hunanense]|nr:hypothetical protein [Undibacterium hunanense]
MNNDAPDNGDFAAYLKNLDKSGKTKTPSDTVTNASLPVFQNSDGEDLTGQELAELPPISDDDLLQQALACEGVSNEYDLDDRGEHQTNDEIGPTDAPENTQTPLAFLGEHALELADQPTPEELDEIPAISDEELIQQALAHPRDNEDISQE